MNSLFLFGSQSDNTDSLTASSETLPVENIQNTQRSKPWRSGAGTESNIELQLANPLGIDHIAFIDLNLTTAGTIRIQAWDDAIDSSPATVDVTISPTLYSFAEEAAAFGDGDFGAGVFGLNTPLEQLLGNNITIYPLSSSVFSAYWKFTFDDENTAYQQLGRLVMASAQTFTHNLSVGYNLTRIDRSASKESLGGQRFVQRRPSRLSIGGRFPFLTDSERAQMLINYQNVVSDQPFVYSIYPSNDIKGLTTTLYGRFENANFSEVFSGATNMEFRVIEEL